jgi:hypothetical protein
MARVCSGDEVGPRSSMFFVIRSHSSRDLRAVTTRPRSWQMEQRASTSSSPGPGGSTTALTVTELAETADPGGRVPGVKGFAPGPKC